MIKITKKRGDIALPVVIFLVLNIIFFSTMFLFVQRVSSNALIYEEAYSKKVGLMLNGAKSGMEFTINLTELVNVALDNGVNRSDLENIIKIDTEQGFVFIKAKPEGGFVFPYFSNLELENGTETGLRLATKNQTNKINNAMYIIKIK